MITLKKGCLKQYDKASRRKTYYDNPLYKKRCKMCGAKFIFARTEITSPKSLVEPDRVCCPYCGQIVNVDTLNDYMPYWRWRLFYEKKCTE